MEFNSGFKGLSNMLIWLDGRESYYVQEVAGSWPIFRPDTLGMGSRWFVTGSMHSSLWASEIW